MTRTGETGRTLGIDGEFPVSHLLFVTSRNEFQSFSHVTKLRLLTMEDTPLASLSLTHVHYVCMGMFSLQ